MTGLVIDPTGLAWEESESGLMLPGSAIHPRKPVAVDLFCGCGGFSLGMLEAGWDVAAAVDWDVDASFTYLWNLGAYPLDLGFVEPEDRARFEAKLQKSRAPNGDFTLTSGGHRQAKLGRGVPVFWLGDVRKLTGRQILDSMGLDVGELDLLFGGPPCQGFSQAGQRNVMDPRNSLVFEFARLVCEMKPKTICLENVPGIVSMVTPEGIPVLDELCAILERGEYGEHEALVRALSGDPSRRAVRRGREKPRRDTGASRQQDLFGGAP